MPFASALCNSTALMLKNFTSLTKVSSDIQSTPLKLTQSPPLRRTYTAPDLIRPIVIEQTVAVKVDGEKESCQKPAHDSAVDGENRAEAKGK